MGRVLVVDDEQLVLRVMERALRRKGYEVDACTSATDALQRLQHRAYDVVLSDIRMAEMDGIALLRAARALDADVPVILVTGGPSVDTAVEAVEHGAFRYLIKPIKVSEVVEVVRRAERMHALIKLRRMALEVTGEDLAGLEAKLGNAMESLWIAYQPIVTARGLGLFGYEALVRSDEPGLCTPRDLVATANRLGRGFDLGRAVRCEVAAAAAAAPADAQLFINLDVDDLSDDALYDAAAPLSALAERVVLEITEHASLDQVPGARGRVDRLRRMGYRIALDDMGAGYAGLTNLAQLEPEIVKLDMSLVRGVHHDEVKRRVIGSMVELCEDLSIRVISEGVETAGERAALTDLGCELMQGYLFARPQREFCTPEAD
jgi:EAL domain-containing protein (putative c-di-GMP-specific phosphodiesterase class I)